MLRFQKNDCSFWFEKMHYCVRNFRRHSFLYLQPSGIYINKPSNLALLYSSLNFLLLWSVSTDISSTDAISSCVQCIWASFSASSKSISFLGLAILIACFYMHRKTSWCLFFIKFPVSLYRDVRVELPHPVDDDAAVFRIYLHSVALAV